MKSMIVSVPKEDVQRQPFPDRKSLKCPALWPNKGNISYIVLVIQLSFIEPIAGKTALTYVKCGC